jgi:AcrR family transcriptional regulator
MVPTGRSADDDLEPPGRTLMTPDVQSSRDKILDVAEALFARRGYSGVGLREVADGVGLSKSSLFHHFPGKVQLYCEVMCRVLRRMDAHLRPALDRAGGVPERLDRWVDALVDGLVEHPPTARLLLRGLVEDESLPPTADDLPEAKAAEDVLASILGGIRSLIRAGVERGELREVSAAHTIQTLIGATVYHFASGELGEGLLGGPLLSAEAVRRRREEVKQLLHQGLLPASGPAPEEPGGTP